MENRRIFERFGSDMIFWLKGEHDEDPHPFVIENISAGGILVVMEREPTQGEELNIEFELPQRSDLIHAKALVRHIHKEDDHYKIGVEFQSVDDLTAQDLVGFLEDLYK